MQLESAVVNPATTQNNSGKIVGTIEFFGYLLSKGSLDLNLSAVKKLPFLSNPLKGANDTEESAIWIGKSIKKNFALSDKASCTAFANELASNPTAYAIGIIKDALRTSWCLFKKGENQAELMATVTVDTTKYAAQVATVK
jgi:hypothetical protein